MAFTAAPETATRVREGLDREIVLRRAIERGEICVYYQPIVQLATGRMADVVALVRWERPRLGLLTPAAFVPIADETNYVCAPRPLGSGSRLPAGPPPEHADQRVTHGGVNLSQRQLQSDGLVDTVARVLQTTGLPPEYLKLEINEKPSWQWWQFSPSSDPTSTSGRSRE